jgi:hypothetical protein
MGADGDCGWMLETEAVALGWSGATRTPFAGTTGVANDVGFDHGRMFGLSSALARDGSMGLEAGR